VSGIEYEYEETIEPRQTDAIIRAWPSEDGHVWLLAIGGYDHHQAYSAARVPTNPADRHELTEAIHGRKIAAIVYEDESEVQVRVRDDGSLIATGAGIGGHWLANSDPETVRKVGRNELLAAEAIARHIEARDAAAKEQERVEEAAVRAKAEELYRIRYGNDSLLLDQLPCHTTDGWLRLARHVLAGEDVAEQKRQAGVL
jgi:hypothetical protein